MKKLVAILASILLTLNLFSQSPDKMSYQAVIRDGSNSLVTSTTIGMKISILQGSVTGGTVYVETQRPISNSNGLVSLEVGSGTLVSGDFTAIDWSNGPYFIKTETDPTGGVSYNVTGTTQLLSVPYALHSKTTETELSFIEDTTVGSSFVTLDTVDVKAGRVVTIKGYINTTGSQCNVYLNDMLNNPIFSRSFIDDQGSGFLTYQSTVSVGSFAILSPWSSTSKEFTSYFTPTSDFQLLIRAKELSSTSGNGVCNVSVIVIQ